MIAGLAGPLDLPDSHLPAGHLPLNWREPPVAGFPIRSTYPPFDFL